MQASIFVQALHPDLLFCYPSLICLYRLGGIFRLVPPQGPPELLQRLEHNRLKPRGTHADAPGEKFSTHKMIKPILIVVKMGFRKRNF